MGIPGLTTFMDKNFHGWCKQRVSGQLVVDGYSLCHHLHRFEWSRGGQYPEYREYILVFFKSMLDSGIRPLVVFDGIDYKQEKVSTDFRRYRERIKHIHSKIAQAQAQRRSAVYGHILPVLAIEVFQLALCELGVPTYVVDGEADSVIVEIANFIHCPVLSYDSDYFMYIVHAGYIPIDRFSWKASPIVAELFYVSEFAKQFRFQDENLRFVIPGVVGNDFQVPLISKSSFLAHIAEILGPRFSESCPLLTQILCYASRFESLEDFLSLNHDAFIGARRLKTNCLASQNLYTCKKTTNPKSLLSVSELRTLSGADIPNWMLKQFRHCSFNDHCMNMIVLGESLLRIVPDDPCKSSSFNISLPVRQRTYGLLRAPPVTEHIRCDSNLVAKKVYPVGVRGAPDVARMPHLSVKERLRLFSVIVGGDHMSLMRLPEEWRFFAAVTQYWASHADVPLPLIYVLVNCSLLCFKYTSSLSMIQKEYPISNWFARSEKWMTTIHAFAQWQCCYFDLMSANQLLMNPLKVISPAFLFDGTIALSLAQPRGMSTLLKCFPIDTKLYEQLSDIILDRTTRDRGKHRRMPSKTTQSKSAVTKMAEKPRRERAKQATVVKKRVEQTLSNRFSQLCIASDSSQTSSDESPDESK